MNLGQQTGNQVAWIRTLLTVAVVVLVQVTVVDQFATGELLRLDFPLLLVIAIATDARSDHVAVVGFSTGLAVDLFQLGPFGQHSLIYCTVAFGIAVVVSTPMAGSIKSAPSRALVAGTATIVAALGVVVVGAAAEPSLPRLSDLGDAARRGSLLGAMVGIQAMVPMIRRGGLTSGHKRRRVRSWSQASSPAPDAWRPSIPPVRGL